jgi:alkylated DNA repair protein alkB family protein 8
LTEPEQKMPALLNKLFEKLIADKIINVTPDQMTVNIYEPGQGIPPHTDNINAFENYIISLSLKSSVQMEFRENFSKRFAKIYLKPNSLLVLKGDARYNWSHLIAERKHDLLVNKQNNATIVCKRDKRISLTFRKVKTNASEKSLNEIVSINKQHNEKTEIDLPKSDLEAIEFERSYVHVIYNEIADHFSHTRHSAWPGVAKFIDSMDPFSLMLDVGCGNGKYLNLRKDLFCVNNILNELYDFKKNFLI